MKNVKVPVGTSDFLEIRRNHFYYVDKTGILKELLRMDNTKVTLITRPRRFGKTLAMNMLANFFDIQKDTRKEFAGLKISAEKDLCDAWQNQYPTIFVSFRGVDGLNFESAFAVLESILWNLGHQVAYLMNSSEINLPYKEYLERILSRKADKNEVVEFLLVLTQMLSKHYHKQVILLIDEYDVPLAKASDHGYYDEMLDVMKGIMRVFKDNEALKLAVITGCLRIAKESIFTGTNNFVSDTIINTRLNEYFGFTQAEVEQLLISSELNDRQDEIREWYDGYRFGEFDIYCPWDVVNYVNDLVNNRTLRPRSYWNNSSDNAIIRSFIDEMGSGVRDALEILLAGGSIGRSIRDDITYEDLHTSKDEMVREDNFWSILYMTGYLTQARDVLMSDSGDFGDSMLSLRIPNREIRELYEYTIMLWFREKAGKTDRHLLFDAVWKGDSEKLTEQINRLLRTTISYHDYHEDFYHAFLAGIFAGAGYQVKSNREAREGRSDIIVKDYEGDRAAVFEIKYAKTQAEMEGRCREALLQINEKRYAEELTDDYGMILCYGIAFYKKRCLTKNGREKGTDVF